MNLNARNIRLIAFGFLATAGLGLILYWLKSQRKPTLKKACKDFQDIYPKVKILGAENSHDDSLSRSFLIRYLQPGKETGKTIEVQFMKNKRTGKWILTPTPPQVLA